jgi:hypothetical protein
MKRLGIYRTRSEGYIDALQEGSESEPLFNPEADDGLSENNDVRGVLV